MKQVVLQWFFTGDYCWFSCAALNDYNSFRDICRTGLKPDVRAGDGVPIEVEQGICAFWHAFHKYAKSAIDNIYRTLPSSIFARNVFRGMVYGSCVFCSEGNMLYRMADCHLQNARNENSQVLLYISMSWLIVRLVQRPPRMFPLLLGHPFTFAFPGGGVWTYVFLVLPLIPLIPRNA